MRCPRCGNENPDSNRFCGMCGATLLQAPGPASQATENTAQSSAGSASAAAPPRTPAAPRAPAPVSDDSPVISGPSFLGLNRPDPRSRASLSINPDSSSSGPRNLDYLLDDDEEEHKGGAGKFIAIFLALALAASLGYLRWRHQGFGWLGTLASKRPAVTQPSDGTDSTPASASSPVDSSTTPAPAPATTTAAQPAPNPTTPMADANPAAPPTAAPASPPNNAPAAGDASAASGTASAPANPVPVATAPASTLTAASAKDAVPATDSASPAADQPNAPSAPAPKPPAAAKPSTESSVDLAKKYIYGSSGVPQDCDRGLKLLKPAADRGNPRAMIELGALYSAGLCTPRDLPTAYRWFAMALHKQPDNQSVQSDLQKLWGEMTQPERQLAIKLSQ